MLNHHCIHDINYHFKTFFVNIGKFNVLLLYLEFLNLCLKMSLSCIFQIFLFFFMFFCPSFDGFCSFFNNFKHLNSFSNCSVISCSLRGNSVSQVSYSLMRFSFMSFNVVMWKGTESFPFLLCIFVWYCAFILGALPYLLNRLS